MGKQPRSSSDAKASRRSADTSGVPSTPAEMGGVIDRRLGLDRREIAKVQGEKTSDSPTGLERRRGGHSLRARLGNLSEATPTP